MDLLAPSITTTPTTRARAGAQAATTRLLFIDNLRWVMILLVISQHAAVTYSNQGKWYYNEPTHLNRLEEFIFYTYEVFLQTFFMGILFFVAGYFVPGAYNRKGPRRFVKDRAYRLGLPTLLYMFFLAPITGYLGAYRRAAGDPIRTFLHEYSQYILRGKFILGTGPLWFCVVLLIFCCIYAAWRILIPSEPPPSAQGPATPRPFPRNVAILGFIGIIALATFFIRLSWPVGTNFYNMQFCYFPQYVAFFIAGILAYRFNWLITITTSTGKRWGLIALVGGLAFWVALLILGGAFNGQTAAYPGGWHWQSLALSTLEAFAGVGISLSLLTLFRESFNSQGPRVNGRRAAFFSANAFAVYVFHAPILIAICRTMAGWHGEALLKFAVATLLTFAVTNALSAAIFRRIPLLKNIL
ncbi:acyltransferase family protein [Puia dinghuensis]|uniref:Acyltransferase 3 domain-containing protein n=1 Tax=Puia dinghuensis TaxID=1792502 RepID=A0A8J2XPW4_9BACT|nr:acyltransferase family protein [Puia dinghuensis]GGA82845.1 hypothetical protein GCM10011511_02340 [Puia dinghuensis]